MWLCALSSLLCTFILRALAVQHFQEVPQNMSIVQGQLVVLRCVIGDRKGAVQWTKDGFSLGFNRTIPGYDRYSVISSYENEFSLMIVSVQLEDDAVYECQVLPRGGDGKLQARATLTVKVPFEGPFIEHYSNGSAVEVPYTQPSLELVCLALKGRPAAIIKWFLNGVQVVDGVRYGVESSVADKRETARSTITIPLTNHRDVNGAVITCQARNEAVFIPLNTSVTLTILFPPGPPELSGYNGQEVSINESMTLICSSKGGNPVGDVTWYRNGQAVDWSFTSGGSHAINEYKFKVASSDNNAVYRCTVHNVVAPKPLTAEYKLKVNFPPASVKISGADEPVQANRTVTLTCVSSNSNPKATITWFAKNRQLPQSEVTETFLPSPEGGYTTRSQIRVTVGHHDHNSVFTCQAHNSEFGPTVADTLTLSVLYPPGPPEIADHKQHLRAGVEDRLSCSSVGGNPLADLKWYRGETLIREAVYKSLGNLAQVEVVFVVKAEDNGVVYKCRASSKATEKVLEANITLNVYFPPSRVEIAVSPSQPKVGQYVDLTCVSSSSNPAAQIAWFKNGHLVKDGVDLGTVPAEHGGMNTTNRLRFFPTSRDHNVVYACRATNQVLDQSVNDAVTLDVLFKPEFDNETIPERVDAKNEESTSLNLTAYANPPDVVYTLYKDGVPYNLPFHYALSNGILNITNVKKQDRGDYMIKGSNSQGFATFNFSLNVKYAAMIVNITNRLALNEGDSALFFCKVDANPMTSDIITWSREDFDMGRAKARTEGDTSYLSLSNVTRDDSGSFRCTADNGIGSPDVKAAKLVVRFAPTIDKSPEISRSAGERGTTASLVCRVQGAPEVTIVWSRNNQQIRSNNKYKVNIEKSSQVKWESSLNIRDLQMDDYGLYTCTASNSKGSDSHSITLTGTSEPSTPYNIEFVNATSNSITLSWNPGFDGGLTQSFRVRYKPVDAMGYVYVDVRPFGATIYKIKGLELGTEYEMTVQAFNERGHSVYQSQGIRAKTSDVVSPSDIATSELQGTDEIPVIIILVVCIVGVFILTLNVGLILFFIRRRKKRMEGALELSSHTNTFELYGSTNKGDHTLYPPPSDDTRSYGTCDKSMDDFSDEYIRDYDPDYPVSRPYSPHKIDSPKLGSGHKVTYILDDHPGRRSPWKEDPYRVANPRHKRSNFENEESNGDLYEIKSRSKDLNELSDFSPTRPSSRAAKTPPPPPTRSSSRGGFAGEMIPPLPARNYEPQEICSQPRYVPTPGSASMLSPNIVANPHYSGSIYGGSSGSNITNHRVAAPHGHQLHNTVPIGAEHRGHLV